MNIKRTAMVAMGCAGVLTGCETPRITSPGTAVGRVGEEFTYQITATREPSTFSASLPPPAGLDLDRRTGLITGKPTEHGAFRVRLGAENESGEGTKRLRLRVLPAGSSPHAVVNQKELFIVAPEVVRDARQARTGGAWHIRSALQRIAGPGRDVDAFADAWFQTWSDNRSLPEVDDQFEPRPWVTARLKAAWRADRIRLLAIVNRLDLAKFPENDPAQPPSSFGEGRFIYEVLGDNGEPLPFTLIFEYRLPGEGDPSSSLATWARRWHALGRPELGGPTEFTAAYLDALQAVTDRFSAHGMLNQIRANEFLPLPDGGFSRWELREFHFVGNQGSVRLAQVPVKLTPAIEQQGSSALAGFIQAQEGSILAGREVEFPRNLRGAVSPVDPGFSWAAPGAPSRASFITSFNSCSGCHAGDTRTPFQHIGVRAPQLSDFLRGPISLNEPLPPAQNSRRTHDEMAERSRFLARFAEDAGAFRPAALRDDSLADLIRARAARPH